MQPVDVGFGVEPAPVAADVVAHHPVDLELVVAVRGEQGRVLREVSEDLATLSSNGTSAYGGGRGREGKKQKNLFTLLYGNNQVAACHRTDLLSEKSMMVTRTRSARTANSRPDTRYRRTLRRPLPPPSSSDADADADADPAAADSSRTSRLPQWRSRCSN